MESLLFWRAWAGSFGLSDEVDCSKVTSHFFFDSVILCTSRVWKQGLATLLKPKDKLLVARYSGKWDPRDTKMVFT